MQTSRAYFKACVIFYDRLATLKQIESMFPTFLNCQQSAILRRSLCVLFQKPYRSSRSLYVSIDQCEYHHWNKIGLSWTRFLWTVLCHKMNRVMRKHAFCICKNKSPGLTDFYSAPLWFCKLLDNSIKVINSNEQELGQSKGKSRPKNQNGKQTKSQIDITQWEQMANRVCNFFPKGGHSAAQTEPKV